MAWSHHSCTTQSCFLQQNTKIQFVLFFREAIFNTQIKLFFGLYVFPPLIHPSFTLLSSHEGSTSDPALVPPVRSPAGNETQVHLEHLPVHRVRRRTGSDQGAFSSNDRLPMRTVDDIHACHVFWPSLFIEITSKLAYFLPYS